LGAGEYSPFCHEAEGTVSARIFGRSAIVQVDEETFLNCRTRDRRVNSKTTKSEWAMSDTIDLSEKLSAFSDLWSPRTVAQFNDCDVMVVKVQGEFVWHKHDDTDDFFLVLKGVLDIQLRDRTVTLGPGQMYIVPRGVEHRPVANDEVHLLLIEPTGTPNTGDAATAALRQTV
jgi:mannose-6-phosphate isomerase-like protein (cupin superfamily)